jgi:hypothetical protein
MDDQSVNKCINSFVDFGKMRHALQKAQQNFKLESPLELFTYS